ncbi:unnamed protein product [Aureobasidium mustum]|uniref:Uncharacterized protein n=1 Tax=Aureobasidium mustum TaxID=2773714 RepID=A0A9N8JDY2_9PEZI|nr:unnamed protein product [Aureobasidium mustum]
MSSYFDVLSWTRARKNREALEKTNPQNPVLNDDDEQFLQRITSQEAPAPPLPTIEPTVIDDEGNEKEADVTQKEAAEMILPASPGDEKEKRTWASYIPSVGVPSDDKNAAADKVGELAETAKETTQETKPAIKQIEDAPQEPQSESKEETELKEDAEPKDEAEPKEDVKPKEETDDSKAQTIDSKDEKTSEPTQRTWASYIPTVPAIPSFGRNAKAHEAAEAAAKAQTPEAKEQDEREVSVLLDRLNLSAINNRVFSFSDQSQRLYSEFTLILKDIVNGAPTAWEDLETLLKENEKHLEQMFKNMPPFVQTLVKSLPSKFATSMGPEIMAMAGDKPGNDLKKQMEAATANMPNLNLKKKQKRKVPNIKDLASSKGTVTSMLTNIVNFLKVRFPAFVTGTNVVMSLAVFTSANVSEISSSEDEDEVEAEPEDEKSAATENDDKIDENKNKQR